VNAQRPQPAAADAGATVARGPAPTSADTGFGHGFGPWMQGVDSEEEARCPMRSI
jgi:hypothetical protein